MIARIAAWSEGRVQVTGVETNGPTGMVAALANGEPVDIDPPHVPPDYDVGAGQPVVEMRTQRATGHANRAGTTPAS